MPIILSLILILSCVAGASAREEYKRDYRKSVAMTGGRTFRIESQFGRISIHGHARNEVAIQASIHCSAGTLDEARRCADQIRIAVDQTGGGVLVRTDYPNTTGTRLSFAVDYDITMPDTAMLDIHNRFGSTEVTNLHASATISSTNGSVRFLNGRGAQHIENTFGMVEVGKNEGEVSLNNSGGPTIAADISGPLDIIERFGEVRVTNAGRNVGIHGHNCNISVSGAGGPVNVTNDFGNVWVSDVRSDLAVEDQNGEITASGVAGKADLRNAFAAIKFSRIGKALEVHARNSTVRGDGVGESAMIETTFGSVDVSGIKGAARIATDNSPIRVSGVGGSLYAKTTFATVTVGDVAGTVTIEAQNSSVIVDAKHVPRCQPVSITTSFGPIRVTIPPGAGYDVAAHTTYGRIHSDPVVQASVSGNSSDALKGKIGGGGCELRLMNQNSSIDILR